MFNRLLNWWIKQVVLIFYDWSKGLKTLFFYQQCQGFGALTSKEVRIYQFEKFRSLVKHVVEKDPFYKRKYSNYIGAGEIINSFHDIMNLPVLTRDELDLKEKLSLGRQKCWEGKSSGSTGNPVRYWHDVNSLSAGKAASYYGWGLAGWCWGMKGLHIWGNPTMVENQWTRQTSKMKAFFFRHYRFPAYKLNEQQGFWSLYYRIKSGKFDFIDGYTNAIYLFARFLVDNQLCVPRLKMVLTTAETLHEYQREVMAQVLGPVFDGYGCGEIKGIAYQCRACNHYHVMDSHVLVEFDESRKKPDGSMPLIITDLDNYVAPLIRYENGDYAKPSVNQCRYPYTTLEFISGRESDMLSLPGGGFLVVPSFFGSNLLKDIEGINQYQVVKQRNGHLLVKLVVGKDFSNPHKEKVLRGLKDYLGEKIIWKLVLVERIDADVSGKYKLVIDESVNCKEDEV